MNTKLCKDVEGHYWSVLVQLAFLEHSLAARKSRNTSEFSDRSSEISELRTQISKIKFQVGPRFHSSLITASLRCICGRAEMPYPCRRTTEVSLLHDYAAKSAISNFPSAPIWADSSSVAILTILVGSVQPSSLPGEKKDKTTNST